MSDARKQSKYEQSEKQRYEGFWKSLHGGFSLNETHYSSANPDPVAQQFISFLGKQKEESEHTRRVLDIGCGNGRNAIAFAQNGFNVTGIDIAPAAINIATQWAKREGLAGIRTKNITGTCAFYTASILHFSELCLHSTNNSSDRTRIPFDCAIDLGCFHHLRKNQWPAYKKAVISALRGGGWYLLMCFSMNSGKIPKFTPRGKLQWRLRNGHFSRYAHKKEILDFFGDELLLRHYEEVQKINSPLKFHVFYFQKT